MIIHVNRLPSVVDPAIPPALEVKNIDNQPNGLPISVGPALAGAIDRTRDSAGIQWEHLLAIHAVAVKMKCIIMFRPFDRRNTPLINDDHPTKNLDIKAKTSKQAPHYGHICVDASEKITSCIREKKAEAIELTLSAERINYLIKEGLMEKLGNGAKFRLVSFGEKPGHADTFEAELIHGTEQFKISQNGTPFLVLAPHLDESLETKETTAPSEKKITFRKGFTADYDLFAVLPETKNLDGTHMRRGSGASAPSVDQGLMRRSMEGHRTSIPSLVRDRSASLSGAQTSYDSADVTSTYETAVKDALNKGMRRAVRSSLGGDSVFKRDLIHHGSDQGNPEPDDDSNFPVTIICPKPIGQFDLISVLDKAELNKFATEAIQAGFHFEQNKKWKNHDLLESSRVSRLRKLFEPQAKPNEMPSLGRRRSVAGQAEKPNWDHFNTRIFDSPSLPIRGMDPLVEILPERSIGPNDGPTLEE